LSIGRPSFSHLVRKRKKKRRGGKKRERGRKGPRGLGLAVIPDLPFLYSRSAPFPPEKESKKRRKRGGKEEKCRGAVPRRTRWVSCGPGGPTDDPPRDDPKGGKKKKKKEKDDEGGAGMAIQDGLARPDLGPRKKKGGGKETGERSGLDPVQVRDERKGRGKKSCRPGSHPHPA